MKRVSAVLAAMATVLAAVPSASADTSPPKPVRDGGRFTQLAIPDGALGVTGLRANADPNRVVSATVVLSTDSIVGARQRAERVGARYDAVAAQRAVIASQVPSPPPFGRASRCAAHHQRAQHGERG